jgi:hypothetical protein
VDLFAVRATAHRIAQLAGAYAAEILAEADGWCRLDRDPREVGAATRTVACALRVDDETLLVTAYGPDGAVATDDDAPRLAGLPAGAGLLHRARTFHDPRYSDRARLADACRALGVPPALMAPAAARPAAPAGPRPTGVVLVRAAAPAAAADAALTGQSAWTVPLAPQWSLHVWDGAGRAAPPVAAADALALNRPTVACWWSADTAGLVVVHRKRVAAHEWGGRAPVTPESAAQAGRVLAADFGVPDLAVAVTALLRRRDRAPAEALAELFTLLGLPGVGIGRATGPELARWAATVPAAVHTERLGMVAAVRRSVRDAPPGSVLEELSARRPLWYRLLNGAVAVFMALATTALAVLWQAGELSGWWVLLGAAATVSYAWGLRPARRRRPAP